MGKKVLVEQREIGILLTACIVQRHPELLILPGITNSAEADGQRISGQ